MFLNVVQPLVYVIIGFVFVGKVDNASEIGKLSSPPAIPITPVLLERGDFRLFGLGNATEVFNLGPLSFEFTEEPTSLDYYLDETPVLGGYYSQNTTFQYNDELSVFSEQATLQFIGSLLVVANGVASEGFTILLQQVPYVLETFRSDVLMLPFMLAFGFSGIIFSVLDLLLLKGYNVVSLFRVTGITEFLVYIGVLIYKILLTFVPFFLISIILGNALGSVLFGNGGRWFATILTMLVYCYSTAPLGALIAKKFIKSDFKTAASVFPGIYLTVLALPYIAWSIAFQLAEGARPVLLVVGDLMSLIPPVAFQRCIGAILDLSPRSFDEDVTWGRTWQLQSRVLLPILEVRSLGECGHLLLLTSVLCFRCCWWGRWSGAIYDTSLSNVHPKRLYGKVNRGWTCRQPMHIILELAMRHPLASKTTLALMPASL